MELSQSSPPLVKESEFYQVDAAVCGIVAGEVLQEEA